MVSFDNDITVFPAVFSSVERMTCAAHGWAKGAELSLRVLNTRMLKLFILWAPLPNYRMVIRDDLSGRYILICLRCYSACSMAALIPADHRHSGHRPETGGQVFVITDAIHPDLLTPSDLNIVARGVRFPPNQLPCAMDTFIRGARTLCAAAAFVTVELRCCSARERHVPCQEHKNPDNKAQSFIPFCCNADGDASASAPASTSKQIIAFCSSSLCDSFVCLLL